MRWAWYTYVFQLCSFHGHQQVFTIWYIWWGGFIFECTIISFLALKLKTSDFLPKLTELFTRAYRTFYPSLQDFLPELTGLFTRAYRTFYPSLQDFFPSLQKEEKFVCGKRSPVYFEAFFYYKINFHCGFFEGESWTPLQMIVNWIYMCIAILFINT